MSAVNFSVPDDVNKTFNAAFNGRDKSAIVKQPLREAVARSDGKERSRAAITRIHQARPTAPVRSAKAQRAPRESGRGEGGAEAQDPLA